MLLASRSAEPLPVRLLDQGVERDQDLCLRPRSDASREDVALEAPEVAEADALALNGRTGEVAKRAAHVLGLPYVVMRSIGTRAAPRSRQFRARTDAGCQRLEEA